MPDCDPRPKWTRTGARRRRLAVLDAGGSLTDHGLVRVIELTRVGGGEDDPEVAPAIEWQDEDGAPHTRVLTEGDFDEKGMRLRIEVEGEDGPAAWLFDEAAVAEIGARTAA